MSVEKRIDKKTKKVTFVARPYNAPSKSFDKEKDAIQHERQILNFRSNSPGAMVSSKTILNEVVRSYFENISLTLKDNTIRSYRSKFNIWIAEDLGNLRVGDIKADTLNTYFRRLEIKGASTGTIYHVRIVLYEIFEFATSPINRYVMENPLRSMSRPTREEKSLNLNAYWSKKEAELFLIEAKKTPYSNMFKVMLETGLRMAEIAALRESDIDFESGFLKVTYQLNKYEAKTNEQKFDEPAYFLDAPKSKRTRHVGLSKSLVEILKEEINKSRGMFIFAPGKTGLKVVVIKRGPKGQSQAEKYVTTRTVSYVMERICKSAGVKFIGPHGLRHTYAATFLMGKGDIYTLSKILGHKSVNTTITNYGHLSNDHLKDASKIVSFGEGI